MDYAEVYIDIKTFDLSLPFDYIIPENLSSEIKTGTVVFVHFNNRKELGFVTRIKQTTGVDDRNLKFIDEIVSNFSIFDRTRLKLIFWMSTYFVQSVSKVINFFLPPGPENKIIKVLKNPDKFIKSSAKISGKNANLSESTLKENNVQAQFLKNIGSPGKEHLSEIKKCMQQHSFGGFLLKNINQSEKIFLIKDLCSAAISMGKTSLILSPETEDVRRLYDILKKDFEDRICVYFSEKKQSEKISAWFDIFFNRYRIITGTRSAIFLPFTNPGIMVLDDVHSTSYKESAITRYDAREIALKFGRLLKIPVVFISNTPSVETLFNFENNRRLRTVCVNDRDTNVDLIKRKIIDLKKIDSQKEDIHITNELHIAIGEDIRRGTRVLIFLNRRGYSSYLVCRDCGNIPKCPNCNISFTFHRSKNSLICHHCSSYSDFNGICSICGGNDFSFKGSGIELFESKLKKRFPDIPVFRIDSDILKDGNKDKEIMERIISTSPAILLGTQAITQKIYFDNISLAAVPDFDSMFQIPDFHISERAYHSLYKIISMVRNKENSRFFIQTFNTSNIVIENFVHFGYDDFYRKELQNRKELFYPPYSNIINIIISGKNHDSARHDIQNLFNRINEITDLKFFLLGPSPAPYYRINLFYRWHIIIKTNDIMRFNVRLFEIIKNFKRSENNKIIADVDPVWIL